MSMITRQLVIAEIFNPNDSSDSYGCIVPELSKVYRARDRILAVAPQSLYPELHHQIGQLVDFKRRFKQPGVIPGNRQTAEDFVQSLYEHLLKAKVPLPERVAIEDFGYWLKSNKNGFKSHRVITLSLQHHYDNFGFWARSLPWVGSVLSYSLIIGFTLSTAVSVFGWGMSLGIYALVMACKLIANYVDIVGGSESRLQKIGQMLDRKLSNIYQGQGKWSKAKLTAYFFVLTVLGASSYLTWEFAWKTAFCNQWLQQLNTTVLKGMALLFASASAVSAFGRISIFFYPKVHKILKKYFDLSEVKPEEKISISSAKHYLAKNKQQLDEAALLNDLRDSRKYKTFLRHYSNVKEKDLENLIASQLSVKKTTGLKCNYW